MLHVEDGLDQLNIEGSTNALRSLDELLNQTTWDGIDLERGKDYLNLLKRKISLQNL